MNMILMVSIDHSDAPENYLADRRTNFGGVEIFSASFVSAWTSCLYHKETTIKQCNLVSFHHVGIKIEFSQKAWASG
jgi:hypothetical protein